MFDFSSRLKPINNKIIVSRNIFQSLCQPVQYYSLIEFTSFPLLSKQDLDSSRKKISQGFIFAKCDFGHRLKLNRELIGSWILKSYPDIKEKLVTTGNLNVQINVFSIL